MRIAYLTVILLVIAGRCTVAQTCVPLIGQWNGESITTLFSASDAIELDASGIIYADKISMDYQYDVEKKEGKTMMINLRDCVSGLETFANAGIANARLRFSPRFREALRYYLQCTHGVVDELDVTTPIAIHDRIEAYQLRRQAYFDSKRRVQEAWEDNIEEWDQTSADRLGFCTAQAQNVLGLGFCWSVIRDQNGPILELQPMIAPGRQPILPNGLGIAAGLGIHIGDIAVLVGPQWRNWTDSVNSVRFGAHAMVWYWQRGLVVGGGYSNLTGVAFGLGWGF